MTEIFLKKHVFNMSLKNVVLFIKISTCLLLSRPFVNWLTHNRTLNIDAFIINVWWGGGRGVEIVPSI